MLFTLEIEALKEEVRETKRTEEEDIPGPKTREGSSKGPSKSTKMGGVTPPSQENIEENTNSSIPSKEKKYLPLKVEPARVPP